MIQDLRFALRMAASHSWFSAAVIVTLALGIGINTTVFTLVNAVLFKPVPLPGGARLVTVSSQDLKNPGRFHGVSHAEFREYREHGKSFEALEALTGGQAVISESGNPPERFRLARVTTGLFEMLRTPALVGRGFAPADGRPGAEPVALLGHAVWQSRYAGRPDIAGLTVRVNGAPATIVGVMPEGFKFPNNEDVWMPLIPAAEDIENRKGRPLRVFGLLKRGTPVAAAGADLAVVAHRLAAEFPDSNQDTGASVRTFHETFNGGDIRVIFLAMLGAVGFVLLIACANVANLMLSRALARQREISVRAALGASRWQLIRQLLLESVLLSSVGGLLGLGLAAGGVHLFDLATRDVGKPYWIEFGMDYTVFCYFAAMCVLSGLLFGIAPALRASRVDLNTALKDGAPSGGSAGGKLTGVLVVVQFALTVVLLAGAGLMIRSFFAAQAMNGFIPVERILTARVQLPNGKGERYADRAARLQFQDNLLQRLATLPGVTHVAATSHLPGIGSGEREIEIEGRPLEDPKTGIPVLTGVHTPRYPAAIDLPVLQGRGFTDADGEAGQEAAIVTREFAHRHWPGESPIGKRIRFLSGNNEKVWIPVVGVTADIVQRADSDEVRQLVFTPYRQESGTFMNLLVRTTGDPAALAPLARGIVQQLDQDLPLFDVRTMREALDRRAWFLVVFGSLFLSFAMIALLMASVGLYAVVAQTTIRRTREIGIRMALGATAGRIVRLVLARGLLQLGLGLVLGLGGAYAATRVMGELLFRTSPQDPVVFVSVTALLIAIGLLACLIPARRAAALHPVKALRHE